METGAQLAVWQPGLSRVAPSAAVEHQGGRSRSCGRACFVQAVHTSQPVASSSSTSRPTRTAAVAPAGRESSVVSGFALGLPAIVCTRWLRKRRCRGIRTLRRAREDIPSIKLAEQEKSVKDVLPYVESSPQEKSWPSVLATNKRRPELASIPEEEADQSRQSFRGMRGKTMRKLLQTYLRMEDVGRIIRMGMADAENTDARGWAAVALCKLNKYKEAAQLAAGPDGKTPCGYQTLRYVAHELAKVGAYEGALHLSNLQINCGRTVYITSGSRVVQSVVEVSALYMQATTQNMSKLLAAHGAQAAINVEKLLEHKNDILALTPNRRYRMLTEAFNQLIRWLGRARLVPQALRACEIMNELGIPRDDMTIHFLSRGAAQAHAVLSRPKEFEKFPPDWAGKRPEVVFIGRVNSGKSAAINALLSSLTKVAPSSKTRAFTRRFGFYEVNRERAGLPHFQLVDTPGLGHAGIPARLCRHWPELIYQYLRKRESLKHVFHLVDARSKKLLPADKQLIHLLAAAQRRQVRYTIVITKIDVVSRKFANDTAKKIRQELAPFVDVDIMFCSNRTLRGIDQLWAKIWQSVTETPRGRRHRELGARELYDLRNRMGIPEAYGGVAEDGLAEMLGIPRGTPADMLTPVPEEEGEDFDSADYEPLQPGEKASGNEKFFNDKWDGGLLDEEQPAVDELEGEDFDGDWEDAEGLDDDELERRWQKDQAGAEQSGDKKA